MVLSVVKMHATGSNADETKWVDLGSAIMIDGAIGERLGVKIWGVMSLAYDRIDTKVLCRLQCVEIH